MRRTMLNGVLLATLLLLSTRAAGAYESPVAVSPGSPTGTAVSEPCPTFNWGIVERTESYELVIYQAEKANEDTKLVLRQSFPGSVHGWTPGLDSCLERGGRYAWSVRAVGRKEASDWSQPSLFQVAAGPSATVFEEALAVVQQYLEEAGSDLALGSAASAGSPVGTSPSAVSPSFRGSIAGPAPLSGAAGDSALLVNGAAVVTTATLGIGVGLQLCEAVDYRYVDLGDGTVLDCNTDLLWLKDASCGDLAGTNTNGQANWETAQSAAAALADGTCGLTDGSSPGDWRQPTAVELCSAWSGSDLVSCPDTAASNSLIDSSVGPPTVVNAPGDVTWSEGDAFIGVNPGGTPYPFLWSATWIDSDFVVTSSLAGGAIGSIDKDVLGFVWPVRDGQ